MEDPSAGRTGTVLDLCVCILADFLAIFAVHVGEKLKLEPVTAVGNPPAYKRDGNGCGEGPPDGQDNVGSNPKHEKRQPEYFPLHSCIVALRFSLVP